MRKVEGLNMMFGRQNADFGFSRHIFFRDFGASLVVFMVALPLCMGIAIACGLHPAAGLVSGIIGGLFVGVLSGASLQVCGPSASFAVLVLSIVSKYGAPALAAIVFLAGVIQLVFSGLKLGRYFKAMSPAVIQGMLSGIGVLIVASQIHVMLDSKPLGSGLENLLGIPLALFECLESDSPKVNHVAGCLGLLTIALLVLWERLPLAALRRTLPSALISIVTVTIISCLCNAEINRVDLPDNLTAALCLPDFLSLWSNRVEFLQQAFVLALVASAESLLSASALDRMLTSYKSKLDRELFAQGLGNMLCGLLGALPLTGVIVRSSVNVQAGALTNRSAVLHGLWILLFCVCFPSLLRHVPTAALAAILVYAGYRLIDPNAIKKLAVYGKSEVLVFGATMLTIVTCDLLTGLIVGVAISAWNLLRIFSKLEIERIDCGEKITLRLNGAATFLSLPLLSSELEDLPGNAELHIDLQNVSYIDHAALELFMDWEKRQASSGGRLLIDWGLLQAKFASVAPISSQSPICT